MILDTNIVIYSCQTGGDWLSLWTHHPEAAIASITRVEALGFTGISTVEASTIRNYLGQCLA